MSASVTGHLAVSCYVTKGDNPAPVAKRTDEVRLDRGNVRDANLDKQIRGRVYTPRFFPGRTYFGEIHIFDEHGKTVHEDVAPGVTDIYGVGIDRDDSVTVLASPTRMIDGTRYFNEMSGTLLKFRPGQGRMISAARNEHVTIPLTNPAALGEPDIRKGTTNFWVQGVDWMYGGVGFCGKNSTYAMGGCSCWNTRFCMDYFGRSFAPEIDRYQVAVLDSAGNLILRVGRYGNVDSAGPDSRVPLGGDEVGLFHAPYVAAHTDKRLFIADIGNQRIASVRLDYHATRESPLRNDP
ncbi:MAG: hypothetical protein WD069_09685 [Planctomycetales bacterium]